MPVRTAGPHGHELIEAAPVIDREAFAVAFLTVVAGEARVDIEHAARLAGRRPAFDDFEVGTYAVGLLGHSMGATDYVTAMRVLASDRSRRAAHRDAVCGTLRR
jgi:amidase